MTALVGIDVGTSGVKAIALSPTGEILARAEREYPLATPQPGWAEQDPHDWVRATDAALEDLDVEPASIGWSGQMHGLVVLDDAELRAAQHETDAVRAYELVYAAMGA